MCALHSSPRPRCAALRPVDQVQVHVVEPESLEASFELRHRVLARRKELGRDEYVVARYTALAQALTDTFLVAVHLRGVDVTVPELERPADRVNGLRTLCRLPHAETEEWDAVAVG